jgi:hypothetical protein
MSFNKLNIYKDLYDNTCINHIWIDLDTIIATDISYMNSYSNIFIENGGLSNKNCYLFTNNNTINIPLNKYIQGNFWKINIDLYKNLMQVLDELLKQKLILRYDLQDLFTYYIYIKNNGDYKDINILGNNIKPDSVNGLCIWSKIGREHPNPDGLNNLYLDNNLLKSKIEIYKELMRLYEDIKSKNLILKYDTQTLFSYYIYYYLKGNLENIYILGNNLKSDTLNGLAIWNKNGNTHATLEGLYNLYLEDNKLKSKFYQNKEIHIVSFTFFTLNEIKKNNYFNQIFNLF